MSNKKYIVHLEHGVWLDEGEGDPCRTTRFENAHRYETDDSARIALNAARKFKPFERAYVSTDFTFKDLRDQLSKYSDAQLNQPINVVRTDNAGVPVDELWFVDEDHINPSGEGIEPISAYSENEDSEEYLDLSMEVVAVKKGTILLVEPDR